MNEWITRQTLIPPYEENSLERLGPLKNRVYTSVGIPTAYGGSQARGWIGAIAAGLRHSHSHSNLGSKPYLQTTPQLMATPDP